MQITKYWSSGLAALSVLFLLAGCGGGDSNAITPGSPDPAPPPPSSADTGTVGIMFTDSPTDDFDQFIAVIRRIELRGDSGDALIFSVPEGEPGEEVDFLALRSFSELFTIAEDVPAGDYEKIRLILDSLTLVKLDDETTPEDEREEIDVDLPGNGKVDLNPRETVFVTPGSTLMIEIDVDAEKSLKVVRAGNSGKYIFRPVVFVNISEQDAGSKLARIFGTVDSVVDEDTFVLCQDERVSDSGHDESDHGGGKETCLTVNVLSDTGVFTEDGNWVPSPVPLTLQAGDPLIAIGNLSVADEAAGGDGGHDDDDLILDAYVLEFGELGTFAKLRGTVVTGFDGSEAGESDYEVRIAGGQEVPEGTILDGDVLGGTRFFDKFAEPLDATALALGATGHFDGVLTPLDEMDKTGLRTSLVVIDPEASDGETVSGDIQAIDTAARTLELLVDSSPLTVCVPEDAHIVLIEITDEGTVSETVVLEDLTDEMTADVFGEDRTAEEGCFVAEVIRAELDASNTAPVAVAAVDGPTEVTVGDTVTLDGSGSFDDDAGDTLTYSWSLTTPAGSAAELSDPSLEAPSFTTDVAGEYVAELIVNDGTEDSSPDSVTVTASE